MTSKASQETIEWAAREWNGYYDSRWSLPTMVNILLKRKVAAWANQLPHGAQVLDIGCARGDLLDRIGQKRPDLELVGVDLSSGMAKLAKRQFGRLHIAQADGTLLPFADQSFDLVLIMHTLSNLDPERAAPALLREACRVSRSWVVAEIKVPSILQLQLAIRETLVRIPGLRWLARLLFAALPPTLKADVYIHRPKVLLAGLREYGRLRPWPVLPTPTYAHLLSQADSPRS
jgi:ubiquinone/menaquinone biosynthesis C-methylase UbiE